jgi:hypothetical protein
MAWQLRRRDASEVETPYLVWAHSHTRLNEKSAWQSHALFSWPLESNFRILMKSDTFDLSPLWSSY